MKKTWKMLTVFCVMAVVVLGSSVTVFAANGTISKEKAKQIALNKANVKSSSVKKWTKVKLDNLDDDNGQEWEIDFQTGSYKYDVEINARTGDVEEFEKEKIEKAAAKKVTKKRAKEISLKRAGENRSSVEKWTKVKLDGKEWEVIFETKSYRYEVEINARTGKIKDFEKEEINRNSSKYIGTEKAKQIALNHAKKQGNITGDVRYTKAKLERDDGHVCYEIDFKYDNWKFEYKIHAETGKILEWDMEYDQ